METELRKKNIARPTYEWVWLAGPLSFAAMYVLLGWFDTSTEITPRHDTVLKTCFALGCLSGLLLAGVAVLGRQEMKAWQRFQLAFALALLWFLSVFLLSNRVAGLVENYIDFPASSTITYRTLLRIDRAYRTHGKGHSGHIQTMPIWSDLEITDTDYTFMLQRRRPGDNGHNPDEISSRGYFCAQVSVQQSGSALRVLRAGSRKLPQGTVVFCSLGQPSEGV